MPNHIDTCACVSMQNVLYGVWPILLVWPCIQYAYIRYKLHHANKFINPDPSIKIKRIHAFEDPVDVEIVARAMRKFDLDGKILDESASE